MTIRKRFIKKKKARKKGREGNKMMMETTTRLKIASWKLLIDHWTVAKFISIRYD